LLENGEKNQGKRCRIMKHLNRGDLVNVVIEVYENEDEISEADLLFATLKH